MKQTIALTDARIDEEAASRLSAEGFCVFRLPAIDRLEPAIASHTDILTFKLRDKIFFSREYFEKHLLDNCPLDSAKIIITDECQGGGYPKNAIFNGLLMGNKLFCKSDTFSGEILDCVKNHSIDVIHVNQGYPACTVLKISESAVITADLGMEKALVNEGISVLRIDNGDIMLPPYEYGFIGGAGAVFNDTVYFFGDITTHRNAEIILDFIKANGKKALSLSKGPLRDLGGIVFI